MSKQSDNSALARRFVRDIFQDLRADAVDELVADDFISHTWGTGGADKAFLKQATERMAEMLTNIRFDVHDSVAEDDRVAVRLTASATAIGEFMGMPAAGKSYAIGEIHIFRFQDGRIAEHWHQYDAPGMMRQLGGEKGAQ